MFRYFTASALAVLLAVGIHFVQARPLATPLEGRWDLTVDMNGKPAPSWLEVTHSGTRTLVCVGFGQRPTHFGSTFQRRYV